MNKEEIIRELEKHTSTVLSFPDRGPWGSSSYRGNCSGWIQAFFLNLYKARKMAEVFAGSGTGSDVCKDMGIDYVGIDLNPNPVRKDIIAMDILDDAIELPDGFYDADVVFAHPPYPGINDVRYSGVMWDDKSNLAARDIQNMPFDIGMKAVNKAILRAYSAMQPGAYEVVLVGEIRSKGQYYSMLQDLVKPGLLHQTFVKLQHNTVSGRKTYGGKASDRVFTGQEFIAVMKKPSGYEIAYVIPKQYKMDIRDSKMATWKDIVYATMRNLGGKADLSSIYAQIDGHERCKSNPHWKEKIRQTLQRGNYISDGKGCWQCAVA